MYFVKLINFFGFNYKEYGIKGHMLTPTWMKVDIINDVIHIYGIPNFSDIGNILVKIIDI